MSMNRRDFIKTQAAIAAATVAGTSLPVANQALAAAGKDDIRWDKGACRFCGTGCGVLIGTKSGKVVATQGDPDSPVNRGLNCIKGYFLSKIMYGEDRLTKPLLRMTDGKYDKNFSNGEEEVLLFTEHEIKKARERAAKNPEDVVQFLKDHKVRDSMD